MLIDWLWKRSIVEELKVLVIPDSLFLLERRSGEDALAPYIIAKQADLTVSSNIMLQLEYITLRRLKPRITIKSGICLRGHALIPGIFEWTAFISFFDLDVNCGCLCTYMSTAHAIQFHRFPWCGVYQCVLYFIYVNKYVYTNLGERWMRLMTVNVRIHVGRPLPVLTPHHLWTMEA